MDKLFFLSKLDHNLVTLNRQPISVCDLVVPVVNQMQSIAKQKNIKIVFEEASDIQLLVDVEFMSRTLTNLIANAIKYGYENTSVKVSAGVTASDKSYIAINNKGRTIPRELHEKIFERFYRSETSRNIEPGGIGLGLSIAKSIVQIHNGKIWVESDSEKGTTFWISLDLKET